MAQLQRGVHTPAMASEPEAVFVQWTDLLPQDLVALLSSQFPGLS
jgi:hypothetical protein